MNRPEWHEELLRSRTSQQKARCRSLGVYRRTVPEGKKRKEKERKPESPAPAQRRMKVAEMQHADVGVGMTGAGVA